ncbi:MAG: ABC transporter permease [Bradyrhizobium sp.]|uniref:ABC transporter permease n=1 Tax=Bradyrhizobium sp. TaxID=376 RepID=UPI001DA090F1|nr:ABC transporter permease [Bradyrhizobium sp.]MBV9560375.1 ABC transporter permease [Bradyrhizobium sp.]
MLTLLTPLIFIALGQMIVLLSAGIDLSVGPVAGLTAVVCSFFLVEPVGAGDIVSGVGLALLASLAVGILNWCLIRKTLVTPVIATLVTFMCIRGSSLWLRSIPGGLTDGRVCDWLAARVGPVPIGFIVAALAALALEVLLRRTRWGLCLRAVGSSEINARKAGVSIELTYLGAYSSCALLSFAGGLMLMAQIGIGDPGAGVNYTLTSITAVVLGGASLFGGRGSFIGAFMGAMLIQQVMNVTTFIRLNSAWQFWLIGILIIAAALLYSGLRAGRRQGTVA